MVNGCVMPSIVCCDRPCASNNIFDQFATERLNEQLCSNVQFEFDKRLIATKESSIRYKCSLSLYAEVNPSIPSNIMALYYTGKCIYRSCSLIYLGKAGATNVLRSYNTRAAPELKSRAPLSCTHDSPSYVRV